MDGKVVNSVKRPSLPLQCLYRRLQCLYYLLRDLFSAAHAAPHCPFPMKFSGRLTLCTRQSQKNFDANRPTWYRETVKSSLEN